MLGHGVHVISYVPELGTLAFAVLGHDSLIQNTLLVFAYLT